MHTLPEGVVVVDEPDYLPENNTFYLFLFQHGRNDKGTDEKFQAIVKKAQEYQKSIEEDFSCGKAIVITRCGQSNYYEPYDMVKRVNAHIAFDVQEYLRPGFYEDKEPTCINLSSPTVGQ